MDIAVLDIGGTAVKYGLWRGGALVHSDRFETHGERGAQDVLRRAGDAIAPFAPFDAIGVSARGQIDRCGTVYFDTEDISGWTKTPVAAILMERFSVPTAVENDVNCMALGEGGRGAARGLRDFFCAAFGTGVGGSFVTDGKLYRGARGFAGEIGLMPYRDAVWETYASVSALVALCNARDPQVTDGRTLCARIGTDAVREALSIWLPDVAGGLCGLIHTFDPECVVLGGGLMSRPEIAEPVAQAVRALLVPGYEGTRITPALLGADAMLIGAALAAEQSFKND